MSETTAITIGLGSECVQINLCIQSATNLGYCGAVTGCEPPLANLEELIANLNATKNLSKFVRLVREGFVQLTQW